jgi:hypothetical protein
MAHYAAVLVLNHDGGLSAVYPMAETAAPRLPA